MTSSPAWIIQKKRDGEALSGDEIRDFIRGITEGRVADYQATAFLMATFFRGMNADETVALTRAMLESGDRLKLGKVHGPKVDKHSTGGVGDKVSLILAPLGAACGLNVPMMAGRGLGHSGGTLDKLEAISGFNVRIPAERFERILADIGCAIIGQSERIAPADNKLYALRDVTATIECIPLITASILSKKLAEGAEALVMDIKVGSGAFMKTRDQARKLSRTIIQVARKLGLSCRALLTNMDQPLGSTAGNALEVMECVDVLRGNKESPFASTDLRELTIQLCAQMLVMGKVCASVPAGRKLAHARLADGSAWAKFKAMVAAQGGDVAQVEHPDRLPRAPVQVDWKAPRHGYVTRMNTETIGRVLVELGGGRHKASDVVDPAVGFVFHKKLRAKVQAGDSLVTVHAAARTAPARLAELEALFLSAIEISPSPKPGPKLILETLT